MNAADYVLGGMAGATGIAGLALHLHSALDGECFFPDRWDQYRLSTRSLQQWDEHWTRHPKRSEIIVCLTTLPWRIDRVERTIKSLLYQSVSPQRIHLHVPYISRREQKVYTIPPVLEGLRSLKIIRCEDYGPATKLIPAVIDLAPHQNLLVVDDDRIYPPDLLEVLQQASQTRPDCAFGAAGWIVPADLTDHECSLWRNLRQIPPATLKSSRLRQIREVNILEGYAGYLVKPSFFNPAELTDYSNAPEAAFYVDDVWISAHCRPPRYVIPSRRHCFRPWPEYWEDERALCRVNNGGGDPEKRHDTIMIRYFHDRWKPLYQAGA